MARHCYDFPRPMVTCDVVVHRFRDGALELLLVRRKHAPFAGAWAIPGGFVGEEEPLEAAALRELAEETGLTGLELRELGTFGAPGRDPRGRTVTVAFWSMLGPRPVEARAGDDAAETRWFRADRLPRRLAFDHRDILRASRARLRSELAQGDPPLGLLPRPVRLEDLRRLCEGIAGRAISRIAFRRRLARDGLVRDGAGGPVLDVRALERRRRRASLLPRPGRERGAHARRG